uniref:ZU5 domain-containing protein n=1 Tax=Amphimedon queenslandica TaxID=400682 RepID=A0A1X7SS50_AMPQE
DESAGESQSTRQNDSEEHTDKIATDDESATDDKSAKTDDGSAKKDDELAKKDDQTNKPEGVARTESFFIQNYAQLLNWEKYGLRITVPEGAVPPSETIEVAITALVGGEFILPEDSELVSAVYTINVSKPLLKPVQLEIQHCVSIETPSHANYLSFVTSSNDQSPFEFQSVDNGSFLVGGRYGSIHISEFSLWGIIKTIKELILPASRLYFAQPLYENKRLGREWQLMFLFGKDLNAIKVYMKDEFNRSKSDKELFFQFESSNGFIEIVTNTENCSEGWSIRPHQENPTQVSQSIIDIYGRMNPPCFPHCRFTITATPGSTIVNPEFKHPVTFRGTVSINTVFNIVLTM